MRWAKVDSGEHLVYRVAITESLVNPSKKGRVEPLLLLNKANPSFQSPALRLEIRFEASAQSYFRTVKEKDSDFFIGDRMGYARGRMHEVQED